MDNGASPYERYAHHFMRQRPNCHVKEGSVYMHLNIVRSPDPLDAALTLRVPAGLHYLWGMLHGSQVHKTLVSLVCNEP